MILPHQNERALPLYQLSTTLYQLPTFISNNDLDYDPLCSRVGEEELHYSSLDLACRTVRVSIYLI